MDIKKQAIYTCIILLFTAVSCNMLDPEPDAPPSYESDTLPTIEIDSIVPRSGQTATLFFSVTADKPAAITHLYACLSQNNIEPDTTMGRTMDLLPLLREGKQSIVIDKLYFGTTYYFRLYVAIRTASAYSDKFTFHMSPQTDDAMWTQVAETPLTSYYTFSNRFVLNDKVYFLSNYDEILEAGGKALWEFNPATYTWSRKADFPGALRSGGVAFSLKGKGYFGGGYEYDKDVAGSAHQLYDWWIYDPTEDMWNKKKDIPVEITNSFFYFHSDTYGYVPEFNSHKEILRYDPDTDIWERLKGYPGDKILRNSCTVSYGNDVYAFGGIYSGESSTAIANCWKYSIKDNQWSAISDFPGGPRYYMVAIVLGEKIYVGGGLSPIAGNDQSKEVCDWWSYDPEKGEWTEILGYPDYLTPNLGFTIKGKGYLLVGHNIYCFSPDS